MTVTNISESNIPARILAAVYNQDGSLYMVQFADITASLGDPEQVEFTNMPDDKPVYIFAWSAEMESLAQCLK